MRRTTLIVLCLTMAGCGAGPTPNPEVDRLAKGDRAIIVSGGVSRLMFDHTEWTTDEEAEVPIGSTVECEWDETGEVGDREFSNRSVRVLVTDGEKKGRVGYLPRRNLRPIKSASR